MGIYDLPIYYYIIDENAHDYTIIPTICVTSTRYEIIFYYYHYYDDKR